MIRITNASPKFTILYLPNRMLRLKGGASAEITEKELDSPEFTKRANRFRVWIEPKPEVKEVVENATALVEAEKAEEPVEPKKKKRSKAEPKAEEVEEETIQTQE